MKALSPLYHQSGKPWIDALAFPTLADAVAALPSAGGLLYLPENVYTETLDLTGKSDVTVMGAGVGTKIKPASGIALNASSTAMVRIDNVHLDGSGGGATGLKLDSALRSYISRVYVTGFSGNGVQVEGDNSTEISLSDVYVADCDGIGLLYNRTTTADTGGIYLTNVTVVKGSGSGTAGMKFVGTSGVAIYLVGQGLVCDGYADRAFILEKVFNWRINGLYATGNVSAKGIVYLNGAGQGIIEQLWCQNANTGGYVVELANVCDTVILNDVFLFGSASTATIAINFTTADHSNIQLGKYHLGGAAIPTLTNNRPHFALIGTRPEVQPSIFLTHGSNADGAIGIRDTESPGSNPNKFIRINNGTLQIINSAFSAVILQLTDGGALTLAGGLTLGGNLALSGDLPFASVSKWINRG